MTERRLGAIAPIRDVIHDYMSFTPFEREIIDSPYFQRLHFVLQNSSAYVTYPSNRNTRFAHSLGVAYLSGRMFVSGLSHATEHDLADFLTCIATFISSNREALGLKRDDSISKLEEAWKSNVGNTSGFSHLPFVGRRVDYSSHNPIFPKQPNLQQPYNPLFLINTLFLAIRCAGLFHDIGHLPTSHVFEHAIDALKSEGFLCSVSGAETTRFKNLVSETRSRADHYLNTGDQQGIHNLAKVFGIANPDDLLSYIRTKQIHETRGLYIMNRYLSSPDHCLEGVTEEYRYFIIKLAIFIISCPTDGVPSISARFIPALKQLIDSELDADRLDYTMRDPFVSGLEFGQLDCVRIIDNLVLGQRDNAKQFKFFLNAKAISNVEQMFHQRALGYQNLIYHRGNMRSQAVLEAIIYLSYVFASRNEDTEFTKRFAEFGFVALKRDKTQAHKATIDSLIPNDDLIIKLFDDSAFKAFLSYVVQSPSIHSEIEYNSIELIKIVKFLAEAFLFRRYRNIVTLFRNEKDVGVIKLDFGSEKEIRVLDVIRKFNFENAQLKEPTIALFAAAKARTYSPRADASHKDIEIYEWQQSLYTTKSITAYSSYLKEQKQLFSTQRNYFIFLLCSDSNVSTVITTLENRIREVLNEQKHHQTT